MTPKVYCEKCDSLFDSREKFDKHVASAHDQTGCDVCVIDAALSKITGFFKK